MFEEYEQYLISSHAINPFEHKYIYKFPNNYGLIVYRYVEYCGYDYSYEIINFDKELKIEEVMELIQNFKNNEINDN